jgi:hypothetical protein
MCPARLGMSVPSRRGRPWRSGPPRPGSGSAGRARQGQSLPGGNYSGAQFGYPVGRPASSPLNGSWLSLGGSGGLVRRRGRADRAATPNQPSRTRGRRRCGRWGLAGAMECAAALLAVVVASAPTCRQAAGPVRSRSGRCWEQARSMRGLPRRPTSLRMDASSWVIRSTSGTCWSVGKIPTDIVSLWTSSPRWMGTPREILATAGSVRMLAPPASVWVTHVDADRSRPFHADYRQALSRRRRWCTRRVGAAGRRYGWRRRR